MSSKRSYGTGSITERKWSDGSVVLYGRWRRADGTRVAPVKLGTKRTPGYADGLTKSQAESALRDLMAADRTAHVRPPRHREHTLADAASQWLKHLETKGAAPTYLQDARSALKHHVLPYLGEGTPLSDVDRAACKRFATHLSTVKSARTGKPLAAKSVSNYLTVLSAVLAHAQREGWVAANQALGLAAPPKATGMLPTSAVMWAKDVRRLVAAALPGDYNVLDRALYTTATMAGLRKGELLGLRWRDLDFESRVIRVHEQLTRGDLRRAPKSGEGRPVPLGDEVAAALLALRRTSPFTAPDDAVFADPRTGQRLAWTPTRRRYHAALKAAGLERFTRFHDTRHSFASILAQRGVAERKIQTWCGHSSPEVTRLYMRSFAPAEAADVDAVNQAFGAGAPVKHLAAVAS